MTTREDVVGYMNENSNHEFTIKELAEHFEVELPKMRGMVVALVRAGKVERLTSNIQKNKTWYRSVNHWRGR